MTQSITRSDSPKHSKGDAWPSTLAHAICWPEVPLPTWQDSPQSSATIWLSLRVNGSDDCAKRQAITMGKGRIVSGATGTQLKGGNLRAEKITGHHYLVWTLSGEVE